jgi:glycine/D-amino acid oxidase-like deaminating enzyme
MSHVVVIGCGVIGAAIAYELSKVPGLKITVLDKQPPWGQASLPGRATGAALGVLMGVISHKIKGKAWQMRQASIQRYETLIPELEALTGCQIPFNRQGILMLLVPSHEPGNAAEELVDWEKLVEIRRSQGWQLEIWDAAQLKSSCPQLVSEKISGAVYSPQDRQVDPAALTSALVAAAEGNGVTFKFGVAVVGADLRACPNASDKLAPQSATPNACRQIQTTAGQLAADWFVVAAGLGSSQLTSGLGQLLDIRGVLGQALHLRLEQPIGRSDFQPVITGNDVHIVPVGGGDYWVGATVEFPNNEDNVVAAPEKLEVVMQQAISFCPALAEATVVRNWSGLRPRPEGRPAPVIDHLSGYSNILVATGHYRNGVLLAPPTAQAIRQILLGS